MPIGLDVSKETETSCQAAYSGEKCPGKAPGEKDSFKEMPERKATSPPQHINCKSKN